MPLEELELDGLLADGGVLLEGLEELDEDEDGVLLEPAPAEPLGLVEVEGALDEDEDEPPLAWSFLFRSIEVDEELEPDGAVLGVLVVPPADDEDDEPGAAVEPEGAVDDELDERSAPRSHAVISDAPSARETATAMVESLMWPPWLGYRNQGARIGPRLLRLNPARVSTQSVLRRRLHVAALGTRAVAALLEVAVLRAGLGIDLPLHRIRAVPFLRACRISHVRGGRGRSCRGLWNDRRAVGFW